MNNKIKCPNCNEVLDVENVLSADIESKFKKEFTDKLNALQVEQIAFEEKKKKENEIFADKLKSEKAKLEKELQDQLQVSIAADFENKIKQLDSRDEKKYGKKFKHFIFSDIKSGGQGAKMLASALLSQGWKLGYKSNLKNKKQFEEPTNKKELKVESIFSEEDESVDETVGGKNR